MRNARLVDREVILPSPKRFIHEKLEMDDGALVDWYFLDTPQSVMIIPITPTGELVMIRQYRYNLRDFTLEFPSGTAQAGEELEDSAARELLEETGFTASPESMAVLGHFYVLPSETNRYLAVILADSVEKVSSPSHDNMIEKYFEMQTIEMTLKEALAEVGRGIQGLETVSALMLAREALQDRP